MPARAWGFKSPLRHAPSTRNRDPNGDKVSLGIEGQFEAQLVIELGLLLPVGIGQDGLDVAERWMNRWKPALNAFAVTFDGRLFPQDR